MDRLDIGRFAVRSCEWNNGGIKGRGVFISMKRTVQKSPPQRLMCSLMLLFLYDNIYTCINIYVYTYIYLGLFARPLKSSSPTPRPFRPPHQQRLHCLAPFIYSLPPLPFPSTRTHTLHDVRCKHCFTLKPSATKALSFGLTSRAKV